MGRDTRQSDIDIHVARAAAAEALEDGRRVRRLLVGAETTIEKSRDLCEQSRGLRDRSMQAMRQLDGRALKVPRA